MKRIKKYLIVPSIILISFGTVSPVSFENKQFVFERTSMQRFEHAQKNYAAYRNKNYLKLWLKRTGIVAGIGAAGYGIYQHKKSVVKALNLVFSSTFNGNDSLKKYLIFSVAHMLIFGVGINELYPFLKQHLFSGSVLGAGQMVARGKRLQNALNLFQRMVVSIHTNHSNSVIFDYVTNGIEAAFSQLIYAIEQVCAALLYEVHVTGNAQDARQLVAEIERVFSYCDAIAAKVEGELNTASFTGFSQDTYQAVMHVSKILLGVVNDYSAA